MQQSNKQSRTSVIGMDLGDRYSHICVLDSETKEVLEESRVATTKRALERKFARLEASRIAFEAGTHSGWVADLIQGLGHDVVVANARKVRLIYENDRKCDRVDAQQLARLAAADVELLHPVKLRRGKTRADRAVLVARDQAVSVRAALVNCVRGVVKSSGERLASGGSVAFARKVREQIPEALAPALMPLLDLIQQATDTIKGLDARIEELSDKEYPETRLLRQVQGVGPITALGFVLTLEDPTRFASSRKVGAFLGLRPKSRSSGKGDPELRISKAGDRMLRKNAVQCAQYILGRHGQESDLRRWGLKLAGRGGKSAKKRAVVAVARKLVVLLHSLWLSGEVYEPLRNSERSDAA